MEIFPAIDLKDGQVVRLTQGDYAKLAVYDPNPDKIAAGFAAQGAKNLHIIDLDGAKDGNTQNFEVIRKIAQNSGLFIQVGGGIRTRQAIEAYLNLGVNRVILGTVAVEDFDFLCGAVREYGEQIAVSVDALEGQVKTRGWLKDSGIDAFDFCKKLEEAGVLTIIYTDIARDGLMQGANIELYRQLGQKVSCCIMAAGGVCTKEDISALAQMKLYAAIVGKALYEGALKFEELMKLC